MLYYNAEIFTPDGWLHGAFRVENGIFTEILPGDIKGDTDLANAKVLPGLTDLHIHGAAGADFSDGDEEGLKRMAAHLASHGITSFLPTSVTQPYDVLDKAFRTAMNLRNANPEGCARIMGIHMEGPYFSEKKKGAQNGAYLRNPDIEGFKELYEHCNGMIRIADAAPELYGAAEFAKEISNLCVVSAAHTDTSYEDAAAFYEAGASHLTHLFNAMPSLHHRRPGVIGAAAERENVTAELISDGYHVHPSAVRLAFKMFPGRICLVSDALRCMGMPEGEYDLGGQKVILKDHIARLTDGTIAGAASNLYEDMRNAISFGIPERDAILAATLHPAKVIKADQYIGSIETGKYADFIIADDKFEIKEVFIGGKAVK